MNVGWVQLVDSVVQVVCILADFLSFFLFFFFKDLLID